MGGHPVTDTALSGPPSSRAGLARSSVGTAHIVFFVVAAAAPLASVVGASPAAFAFGNGAGVPGVFLLVGLLYLTFSVGFTAMSRFAGSVGGFYSYIAKGLGRPAGVAAAAVAILTYKAIQMAVYALFGVFLSAALAGFGVVLPWWAGVVALMAGVALCGRRNIAFSGRLLGLCMLAEVAILALLDVGILLRGGGPEGITVTSFAPSTIFVPGLGAALVFVIGSFMGFEATAIFAEEAKDPKRTVPRATYGAVILISTFYMITSWAMISGASDPVGGASGDPANFAFDQIRHYLGSFGYHAAQILVLTSFAGCALGIHNAASRYFFALGRDGVLPRALGETNRHRSPGIATITQISIAAIIIAIFAIAGADPYLTLGTSMAALASLGILFLQMMVCLAVIGFFRRRDDGTIWSSIVAPTLGALGMAGAIVLILVNYDLVGHTSSEFLNHIPWLLVVVGIGGLAYGTYLKVSRPRKYADVATALESDFVADAFVEMTEPAPAGQPAA
jgi:amino acid transporter